MDELARIGAKPIGDMREDVMAALARGFAGDLLLMEEYERRAGLAARAETKAELVGLIEDLPLEPSDAPAPPARVEGRPGGRGPAARRTGREAPAAWTLAEGPVPERSSAVCIFGGADRKGAWKVPRRLDALCVFGGASLDLRKAIIPEEGATISCIAAFGGVDIVVPPGLRVECNGMGILGGFDSAGSDAEGDSGAPLIKVEGIAVFGGVSIRIKA